MKQADVRSYRPTDVVMFRKTAEEFGGLSNMAPGYPMQILDLKIRTSEALYQACRFPHLPEVQRAILAEASPMTLKMKSKPLRDQTRAGWDQIRVPIMKWCLRVKLVQNWDKFGDLLSKTGSRPIVESSKRDDFWGAVPGEDGLLHGQNVLGRLLMELRENFNAKSESLKVVHAVKIPDFTLIGCDIPAIPAVRDIERPKSVASHRQVDMDNIWQGN